jgi:hypothetical protein
MTRRILPLIVERDIIQSMARFYLARVTLTPGQRDRLLQCAAQRKSCRLYMNLARITTD